MHSKARLKDNVVFTPLGEIITIFAPVEFSMPEPSNLRIQGVLFMLHKFLGPHFVLPQSLRNDDQLRSLLVLIPLLIYVENKSRGILTK